MDEITLAESDEDDDLLYSAGPLPESKNIFETTQCYALFVLKIKYYTPIQYQNIFYFR